jgi:hypothetical protein
MAKFSIIDNDNFRYINFSTRLTSNDSSEIVIIQDSPLAFEVFATKKRPALIKHVIYQVKTSGTSG